MGSARLWILFSIIVLLIAVGVFVAIAAFSKKKGKKYKPDYYTYFIIGITWTAIGIPLKNAALFGLGIVFMITGLIHKKEWKKNRKNLKHLNKKQRKIIIILLVLGFVLLSALVLYTALLKRGYSCFA